MSYFVNYTDKDNKSPLTVFDNTSSTDTSLTFPGRNVTGYGQIIAENFLHLLENFANTSPPPKPVSGQIWYDSTATQRKLKFYDGTRWKIASGAAAQTTAPSGLSVGEFWFDTSTKQVSIWDGTEFVLVGPESTPDLTSTSVIPAIVKDNQNPPVNHSILKINVQDETMAVISSTEFILNSTSNPISGFTRIKKGFTLINTPDSGVTTTNHFYWGTASSARGLVGPNNSFLDYTNFLLQSQAGRFGDDGIRIGDSQDIRIWVEDGDVPVFENQNFNDSNNSLIFRLRTEASGVGNDPLVLQRTAAYPGDDNFYDLGLSTARWKNVYGITFRGNLIGNVTGNIVGNHTGNLYQNNSTLRFDAETGTFYGIFGSSSLPGTFVGIFNGNLNGTASNSTTLNGVSADVNPTPNTIALRDNSANLFANRFIGTASRADTLLVGSDYRSASTSQTGNTIAVRDVNADITARFFVGTATSAQYADLAEKYLADKEYPVGTVMSIGGEKEVTASTWGDRAIGVVSGQPAFMMNSELEGGTYVALKGRVPVRVIGAVRKGQRLIATNNGCAVAGVPHSGDVFAIAMENSTDIGEKTIECVVL